MRYRLTEDGSREVNPVRQGEAQRARGYSSPCLQSAKDRSTYYHVLGVVRRAKVIGVDVSVRSGMLDLYRGTIVIAGAVTEHHFSGSERAF
jgi:2-hydroxychromene-2-carboxylate isomerase